MSTVKIPNGHQAVMPYLMLNGAEKFSDFVTKVLNGKITSIQKRENEDRIMHAEVEINGSTIMFCDSNEKWPASPANLFVYVSNADDTYKTALENSATNIMEPADQDYGRSCGITDPCGNIWWITSVL